MEIKIDNVSDKSKEYEEQCTTPLTISRDSLANYPEKLVIVENKYCILSNEYNQIKECKCHSYYDRTDQLKNVVHNVPKGFNTPLDFFESTLAVYLAKQFSTLQEINIVSFAAGYLLRELIFIAKLMQNVEYKQQKIILHAIDLIYVRKTEDSRLCQQQFKELIYTLNLNIDFKAYGSVDEYNQQRIHKAPSIILAIDSSFRFDSDFPSLVGVSQEPTDKICTQEGILDVTKTLEEDGSYYATLTHIPTNKGMHLILDKKVKGWWERVWLHTIYSLNHHKVFGEKNPPPEIKEFLCEKEKQFYLTNTKTLEDLQSVIFDNLSDKDEKSMSILPTMEKSVTNSEPKVAQSPMLQKIIAHHGLTTASKSARLQPRQPPKKFSIKFFNTNSVQSEIKGIDMPNMTPQQK